MTLVTDEKEIAEALRGCENEEIHIPGIIQPIGCLLGAELETGRICYVSQNSEAYVSLPPESVLGRDIREVLGPETWHSAKNAASLADFESRRVYLTSVHLEQRELAVSVSKGGDYFVFEIEPGKEVPQFSETSFREQAFLLKQLEGCRDIAALFDMTVRLSRHLTGFEHVMLYKFDDDWNGEVIAEAKKGSVETMLGLRFPHWDIPAQARAIMERLPLRLIADVDQPSIDIIGLDDKVLPLDISLAQLRGVSTVHLQYLRNMGSRATMTLSVVLEGKLWGIISFHHKRAKVTASHIRHLLTSHLLPFFCLKLSQLEDRHALDLSQKFEVLQTDLQQQLERGKDVGKILAEVGPAICEMLVVDGISIRSGKQTYSFGEIPRKEV